MSPLKGGPTRRFVPTDESFPCNSSATKAADGMIVASSDGVELRAEQAIVGYKAAQEVALTVTGKLKKTPARSELEAWGDFLYGFGGGDYWVDFEVD